MAFSKNCQKYKKGEKISFKKVGSHSNFSPLQVLTCNVQKKQYVHREIFAVNFNSQFPGLKNFQHFHTFS